MNSYSEVGAISRQLVMAAEQVPKLGVCEVFAEPAASHMLWCNSKGQLELIATTSLQSASDLAQQLGPLFDISTPAADRFKLCSQLIVIAEQTTGGAAFLTLLNNSAIVAGASLSELSSETVVPTEISAIFDAALLSAPEYQRSLVMYSRLPWASVSLQSAIISEESISVPVVMPSTLIDQHYEQQEQLSQLLESLDKLDSISISMQA